MYFKILIIITKFLIVFSETIYKEPGNYVVDYKIEIESGKKDCYSLHVPAINSSLIVSSKVYEHEDALFEFTLIDAVGQIVKPEKFQENEQVVYQLENVQTVGFYHLCINNAGFLDKYVNVYVRVHQQELWDKYYDELDLVEVNVQNFTDIMAKVVDRIDETLDLLHFSRENSVEDYMVLYANRKNIDEFSFWMCVLFIVTYGLQVFFVRRMFKLDKQCCKIGA